MALPQKSSKNTLIALVREATLDLVVLAMAVLGALAWCLNGPLDAVRRRLSGRFADWLLPERQASTIRIALALTRIASRLAPRQTLTYAGHSLGTATESPLRSLANSQYGLTRRPNIGETHRLRDRSSCSI
jgi:hypothetical protein